MKWALARHNDRVETGLDQVRREMDGFFDEFLSLKPTTLFTSEWVPSMDVSESDKEIHVRADMPGMTEKDISVSFENGVLAVSGEKKEERREEKDNSRYIISERRFGSFYRTVTLPENINADTIKAEFKNGILDITVMKNEKAQPKSIRIQVK
jgi:HSP20 family protein